MMRNGRFRRTSEMVMQLRQPAIRNPIQSRFKTDSASFLDLSIFCC
jgi:hypothetical protein